MKKTKQNVHTRTYRIPGTWYLKQNNELLKMRAACDTLLLRVATARGINGPTAVSSAKPTEKSLGV